MTFISQSASVCLPAQFVRQYRYQRIPLSEEVGLPVDVPERVKTKVGSQVGVDLSIIYLPDRCDSFQPSCYLHLS